MGRASRLVPYIIQVNAINGYDNNTNNTNNAFIHSYFLQISVVFSFQ